MNWDMSAPGHLNAANSTGYARVVLAGGADVEPVKEAAEAVSTAGA
ncbi:hypothetical protein ACPPVO_34530 [Dactylosporangium sp. McL0621]